MSGANGAESPLRREQQVRRTSLTSSSARPVGLAQASPASNSKTLLSRGSSATSVAMSDTQVSVSSAVSSAAAGGRSLLLQQRRGGQQQRAPLKKSSSSLSSSTSSSAAAAARQKANAATPRSSSSGSATGLSFSGIRRPVGKPASSVAAAAAAAKQAHSLQQHQQQQQRAPPTVAMSMRDKDQQIKLLIKERDEQKFQAELMAGRAEEWREKFEASELERRHMTSEADDEVVELRRLAQEFEDENKRLAERLAAREQAHSDAQFKLDELDCERQELRRELADRAEQIDELEQERRDLLAGSRTGPELITERQISKAKYEREIEELKEVIQQKDESLIQLRSSLEMRKNEVNNLQSLAADLERKLKIESERSERHLKRIDEINLELRAAEERLATKTEENAVQEKQVKQLRQEVRTVEDKLEQLSLARKKDVDILHCKLSAARGGRSATPTGPSSALQQSGANSTGSVLSFKTPTPQDEIVRLQMEIRELKDQLIDREAELDCNRRDLEVIKRKMETRTLEVDCNNQELARRCQDLLEQNRQSEDTVKQLLKSTTEHSAQLLRATDDLKEANGKCIRLRDEVNTLEAKLDAEMKRAAGLQRENNQLKEDNQLLMDQVDQLRHQVDSLNEQLGELCEQLDVQTQSLHKDREQLADQLSEHEINAAQLRQDLASAKQDLRTNKLQTQEVITERDRLRSDLDMKEKYIRSRNDMIEQMRHELDDSQKSLADYKLKLDKLRQELGDQLELSSKEFGTQLQQIKLDLQAKVDECSLLRGENDELLDKLEHAESKQEQLKDEQFDEMRRKHSAEVDELKLRLAELADRLEHQKQAQVSEAIEAAKQQQQQQQGSRQNGSRATSMSSLADGAATSAQQQQQQQRAQQDYESQIEFLNSLVVDMQRKADDYKNRLASLEAVQLMNDLLGQVQLNGTASTAVQTATTNTMTSRTSTLKRNSNANPEQSSTIRRHVRIQDPVDGQISSLNRAKRATNESDGDSDCTSSNGSGSTSGGGGSSDSSATTTGNASDETNKERQKKLLAEFERQMFSNDSEAAAATAKAPSAKQQGQQQRNFGLGAKVPMRHISGRPFCDICQIYDLHHTVYCPRVSEKLSSRREGLSAANGDSAANLNGRSASDQASNNNNNNNDNDNGNGNENDNNNYITPKHVVDEMFREYEESLESAARQFYPQFASLRRPARNNNTRRPPI